MKKSVFVGVFVVSAAMLFAPADEACAKEIPADGNIPVTSEYFPDSWFLSYAKSCDKNEDGYLSSEEVSSVTDFWCVSDLSDFSQVQYFTNLRELEMMPGDDMDAYDIWVGEDIDLTVFPNLERARLFLDSRKAPAGAEDVQVKVSGMEYLKNLEIYDKGAEKGDIRSGADARIGVIDLRGTKGLESVYISDVKGVIFDSRNQIKSITLGNTAGISGDMFEGFDKLEKLSIWSDVAEFTSMDVAGLDSLTWLSLNNDCLRTVALAGADALQTVKIESSVLEALDLPRCPALTGLTLDCPNLKELGLSAADMLEDVTLESDVLDRIVLRENVNLERLSLTCPKLKTLDVKKNRKLEALVVRANLLKSLDLTKNGKLEELTVVSASMKKLDLKKNKKLKNFSVDCKKLGTLDLSANTKLRWIFIDGTSLKSLNLSKQKELTELYVKNNKKLTALNVSGNKKLRKLVINGNKKLTALDLSGNQKLYTIDVKNNGLKSLKLGKMMSLNSLYCQKNSLKELNLSGVKASLLRKVCCDKGVKVKGYKGKVSYK